MRNKTMSGRDDDADIALADPQAFAQTLAQSQEALMRKRYDAAAHLAGAGSRQAEMMARALSRQSQRIAESHSARIATTAEKAKDAAAGFSELGPEEMRAAATAYMADLYQRAVLMLDAFRQRGDMFLTHEAEGCPPVLSYDYETVLEGRDLPHPSNYMLLHILAPEGVKTIEAKRPYIIIDPRAGHGPGIGGFKPDSQVGVALRKGHPVYFVAFHPEPVDGQTLASVTRTEAEFVREVMRRHPNSNKPIVIGNCQGGWATALLAATNPDITGPVVFNGAPMSYWSGKVGESPMRYNGGLLGGVLPAMVMADLSEGKFDGAWLVSNFEMLNPSRNFFRQYYDLFRDIDSGVGRFLEFQKWWGGYFWMNEAEIRWIVEQLFVGNKLARGEASLEHGRFVDVKRIRAPIIVFASHGDNITPPQQALNWIVDAYASEEEIKLNGQRIIYILHETVGHLGIFVSSSIARREHSEMASTMKTIETLAPGLYEMVIQDVIGEGHEAEFVVSFEKRTLDSIRALDDGREEEEALGAVARASALSAELYDIWLRPAVRSLSTAATREMAKSLHPLRAQRSAFATVNPWMALVPGMAKAVQESRQPADRDNPFVVAEALAADLVEQGMDWGREIRDMLFEAMFLALWASPAMQAFGAPKAYMRTKKDDAEMRLMPEVQSALLHMDRGGLAEAVIRMLIMLAEARGAVRRDRLERSAKVLSSEEPFCSIAPELRSRIIHEQSICAQFDAEAAIASLPALLPTTEAREGAMLQVEFILGPLEEMEPNTIHRLQEFRRVLSLDPIAMPEAVASRLLTS